MLIVPNIAGLQQELWERRVAKCTSCGGVGSRMEPDPEDPIVLNRVICGCKRWVDLRVSYLNANIPREFWDLEMKDWVRSKRAKDNVAEYIGQLRANKDKGIGLIMLGENGVGKTLAGAIILKSAVGAGYSAGYITIPEFISSIIPADREPELSEWLWYLLRADFLVLDEVGKEYRKSGSEHVRVQLDSLLRERRGQHRPTILISNFEKDAQLRERYGESITSILIDRTRLVAFSPGDFRLQSLVRGGAD